MLSNEQIILYLWNNNKHTFVIVWKYYNSHVSKIDHHQLLTSGYLVSMQPHRRSYNLMKYTPS